MPVTFDRWCLSWEKLGLATPGTDMGTDMFRELVGRYSEPHRKYHTLEHLDECFAKLEELQSQAAHPGEIEIALWFHDAIYDVTRHDNEERSAVLAGDVLRAAGSAEAAVRKVQALIAATKHHQHSEDPDTKILLDVDLSILASPPARFQEYEQQIREEYAWVAEAVFAIKRRNVLLDFLKRPRLFATATFFERYESTARTNLRSSLGMSD